MGKTLWNPELGFVFSAEFGADPGPVCGGATSDVDGDVENCSEGGSNNFRLRFRRELIVQTSQYSFDRAGVVVLGENHSFAYSIIERTSAPAFVEPASVVSKAFWSHQQWTLHGLTIEGLELFKQHLAPQGWFAEQHGRSHLLRASEGDRFRSRFFSAVARAA